MPSLFDDEPVPLTVEWLEEGAAVLRGFATQQSSALVKDAGTVASISPFRYMVTPGGYTMSVAMTNCGRVGWVSDSRGYRYDAVDPETSAAWPGIPATFLKLATSAAEAAGFANYDPDACLINRYSIGAKLSLHQDRDENDRWAPIVSVSLGLPATFLWGGQRRRDLVRRLLLESGDVVVWGGPARFVYHGVAPLKAGEHPLTGETRINLTFRKVY